MRQWVSANRRRISYGIPDVSGTGRDRSAGKRVLVIGNGHSAMDAILGLVRLKEIAPRTKILWAMRNVPTEKVFGGLTDDQLASRGALGERAKAAVDSGQVEIVAPFRTREFITGRQDRKCQRRGEWSEVHADCR